MRAGKWRRRPLAVRTGTGLAIRQVLPGSFWQNVAPGKRFDSAERVGHSLVRPLCEPRASARDSSADPEGPLAEAQSSPRKEQRRGPFAVLDDNPPLVALGKIPGPELFFAGLWNICPPWRIMVSGQPCALAGREGAAAIRAGGARGPRTDECRRDDLSQLDWGLLADV
jgi:hypothetical protein